MHRENNKITSEHLAKKAIVYIRQSTTRQLLENSESTIRQYGLKQKLIDLGWPLEYIQIIDQDLGKSGVSSKDRDGFQTLVADVSNGLVGAVACIECSRLSRDSEDWGRLIKFCAYTNTLLIDTDGVYDPNDFNDSLLLGFKGTLNSAELHFLRERMHGGLMNKVKRGELRIPIPIGYMYNGEQVIKDPDIEIQKAIELCFDVFRRQGSACRVVRHFWNNNLKFPRKSGSGFDNNDAEWVPLNYSTVKRLLHNPFYAGAYYYGRSQTVWTTEGKKPKKMPREKWHVFIKDHHDSYISFNEYEENERTVYENRNDLKSTREKSPPREGPALLQGLVFCGKCGCPMSTSYQYNSGKVYPVYRCDKEMHKYQTKTCQSINGLTIDKKITEILIDRLTPDAIEQAINVRKELDNRQTETITLFELRVKKCEYSVEQARKRYMSVDSDNRLVALQLETSWNKALNELENARNEYAHQLELLDKAKKERDYNLTANLSQSFRDAFLSNDVSNRDKKRMVRYLIEDVTLLKTEEKTLLQIRFKGDTTQIIEIAPPVNPFTRLKTDQAVIEFIDTAAENFNENEIAVLLNQEGFKTGRGFPFSKNSVRSVLQLYSIPNKKKRYLSRGYITTVEKAKIMGVSPGHLSQLVKHGNYHGEYIRVNSRKELLFKTNE